MITVQVKRLDPKAILPSRGTQEAACFDLYSNGWSFDGRGYTVYTGLSIAIPSGYGMLIHPRSGLATKLGLTLQNTTGVIDSDYRGEIMLKFNRGLGEEQEHIQLLFGSRTRVAQAMILQVPEIVWEEVDTLPSTERGTGGFGSTGTTRVKEVALSDGRIVRTSQASPP